MRIEIVFGVLSAIGLASTQYTATENTKCGGAWSQCGGINFRGSNCCIEGFTCKKLNDWYSFCDGGNTVNKPNVNLNGHSKRDGWGWGNWNNNWNNNNNANNAANPWNNWNNNNNNNQWNNWNNNNNNNNQWNNWNNNNNNNQWNNWNNNNNNNNNQWNNWNNQQPAQQPTQQPTQQQPAQQTNQQPTQQTNQQPTQQPAQQTNQQQNNNVSANANEKWPKAQKSVKLDQPIVVKAGQTFDGLKENGVWTSYGRGVNGGDCKNVEGGDKDAVFRLETGATLKNVILGKDSIEHVHCIGDGCNVENVWWDDVCEDALTLKGSTNSNAKFYLTGGGAKDGSDKIVQHNSAGTVYIKNFEVINGGKLYRACGNCKSGYQNTRHVVIENVNAKNTGVLAGINANYGDTATFKNVNANGGNMCYTFTGNNNGSEPSKTGAQCKGQSNCTCK